MKQKQIHYPKRNHFGFRVINMILIVTLIITVVGLIGCSEADRVTYNLSTQADNFNVLRQVTVINCISNDVIFQMTGKMSINADTEDNQLEIVVENDDGTYAKHIIGLSDNVTYVVEDIDTNYVNKYKFTINYNPDMWIPADFDNID